MLDIDARDHALFAFITVQDLGAMRSNLLILLLEVLQKLFFSLVGLDSEGENELA